MNQQNKGSPDELAQQVQIKTADNPNQQKSFAEMLGLKDAAHPVACFFALLFKIASILIYLIYSWIIDDYILAFIFTSLLLAADFWTIKNVSGRLLVGLRWWTKFTDEGGEEWIYESKNTEYSANKVDYICFWYGQALAFAFWLFSFIMNMIGLRFTWAVLNFIGVSLGATNLKCFYKCSKHHQEKLKGLKGQVATTLAKQAVSSALNNANIIRP